MTSDETRIARASAEIKHSMRLPPLTTRMRRLLWLLCLNGALLGLEGMVQRVAGSNKLLFLVIPEIHKDAVSQFGPYAYRSNAAQYFNLLWPVCLGFWWTLHRAGHARTKSHHLLLICAAIMAACPIISTTRAGAIVAAGMLVIAVIYLVVTNLISIRRNPNRQRSRWLTMLALAFFFAGVVGLGWYLGWENLAPRMDDLSEGYQNRAEMYDMARPMAQDYPWFGTGPGTFSTVFRLYLVTTDTYWPEQLHNDWLETRITFGMVGFALILAALVCVVARGFARSNVRVGRRFFVLAWLALAGCLVQALVDFPFQVHSVLFLFLLICATLFCLGRNSGTRWR
jgi:O-antigen ligase